MTLRRGSGRFTVCEVLRSLNDLCQGETQEDQRIRKLLVIAERKMKKLSYSLLKENEKVFKNYWKRNPKYLEDRKRRFSKYYLIADFKITEDHLEIPFQKIIKKIKVLGQNKKEGKEIEKKLRVVISMAKKMKKKLREYKSGENNNSSI